MAAASASRSTRQQQDKAECLEVTVKIIGREKTLLYICMYIFIMTRVYECAWLPRGVVSATVSKNFYTASPNSLVVLPKAKQSPWPRVVLGVR